MAKRQRAGFISRGLTKLTFIQGSRQIASEQKAIFHHVMGAGRSRVLRQFFGSTDAEKNEIRDSLERLIAQRLDNGR
jgi:polyphosphate kinase